MKLLTISFLKSLYRRFYLTVYSYPLLAGIALSIMSSLYLIVDLGIVNGSALLPLWQIAQQQEAPSLGVLGYFITFLHHTFAIEVITAAYLIMVIIHALIMGLLLLMARCLSFSVFTRWSLIFVVLVHTSYNDFRSYILPEPLFWLCWLLAIYLLLLLHKNHTLWAIVSWLGIFLLASQLNVASWFWLLLFPFGALFWKPWRRKSVAYALLAYAVIISVLLFLPLYQGVSPIQWFSETLFDNPSRLSSVMSLNNNNWVQEDDHFMLAVLVISGALSLVVMRLVITLGVGCAFLAVYAVLKKQYRMIDGNILRIVIYAITFDLLISMLLLIVAEDKRTVLSFSTALLLMFFSALGLSYVLKKLFAGGYSRLTVLVIVWCLVAYLASGYIIFGSRKGYQREAGEFFVQRYGNATVYSNNSSFLFYVGKKPTQLYSLPSKGVGGLGGDFYYAYDKFRSHDLPPLLATKKSLAQFSNRRGDTLFIYYFPKALENSQQIFKGN